jgi:hypothetical protein
MALPEKKWFYPITFLGAYSCSFIITLFIFLATGKCFDCAFSSPSSILNESYIAFTAFFGFFAIFF